MREKEGIASDNYSDQLDKEKPKNLNGGGVHKGQTIIF